MFSEMEASTGVTPPALLNAPLLEGDLRQQYEIFSEVSRDRRYSMSGPLPISSGDLLNYFNLYRVPRSLWQQLTEAVIFIDRVWMSHRDKAAEAELAASKAAAKKR